MSTQTIKTTFKLRRGASSEWQEKNPILAEGEPGFELDTGKLKIGSQQDQFFNDADYIKVDYNDVLNKQGIIPAYEFIYNDKGDVVIPGQEALVMYVGWDAGSGYKDRNKPKATGLNSMALGPYCEATYRESVALNYMGLAHAARSFACGRGSEVLGAHGAAFNRQTKAGGVNSATFGINTAAYGYCSAAFGQQTYVGIRLAETEKNGVKYYSIPLTGSGGNSIKPLFTPIASYNGEDTAARPTDINGYETGEVINLTDANQQVLRSITFGHLTVANGENAIAAGNKTIAIGKNAIAMGYAAQAQGDHSFAFGSTNPSASSLEITVASGRGSLAFGFGALALGDGSISFGNKTKAYLSYACAIGIETTASGAYSAAFNANSSATQQAAFACNSSVADGAFSFSANGGHATKSNSAAFNKGTASAEYSFSIGAGESAGKYSFSGGCSHIGSDGKVTLLKASGMGAFAFGAGAQASGDYSLAIGQLTTASASYSFAGGNQSTASGTAAIAFGRTKAVGNYSAAFGFIAYANHPYSLATGYYTATTRDYQVVMGTYCDTTAKSADKLLIIGNGTAHNARNNAFAVGDDFIEINNVRLTSTDLQALLALLQP